MDDILQIALQREVEDGALVNCILYGYKFDVSTTKVLIIAQKKKQFRMAVGTYNIKK